MAFNIVTIEGKQVVFGLQWVPLAGEAKEKAELREHVSEHNVAYTVRCAGEHSVVYGLLTKDNVPDDVKKPQLISAAALLASKEGVSSRAIFIETATQFAHLVIIDDGVPVPGGDFYGSIHEAQDIIRETLDGASDVFTIYSNDQSIYGDAVPLTLAELLVDGDNEKAKLTKVAFALDGKIIALLVLTVLMGVVYGGYSYYRAEQTRLALEAARRKPIADPNKLYAAAVQTALATTGLPGPQAVKYFSDTTAGMETYVAGWKLSEINCVAEGCAYVWDINGGTNETFVHAMGPDNNYQFGIDGTQIKYQRPINSKSEPLLNVEHLPDFNTFVLNVGSFRQRIETIGMKMNIETPVIFGDVTGITVSAIKNPIRTGRFSIEGPQALGKDVVTRIPYYMTVNAYNVKVNGINPTFKMEGYYYVQN